MRKNTAGMQQPMQTLIIYLEMLKERKDLELEGWSTEEIDGYFEFFIDNYTSDLKVIDE